MPKLSQLIQVSMNESQRAAVSSDKFKCRFVNQDDGSIDLLIYGVVGDEYEGLDAKSVAEFFGENKGKKIRVRINSPGGLAFEGITIHNALVKHDGEVVTEIEGIAASAAAIIAVAGDTVRIVENGSMFIHRAMGITVGNKLDMEDMAEFLATLDEQIARTFAAKSGQAVEKITELLTGKRDGTMLKAEEAVALGLADEVVKIREQGQGGEANADPKAAKAKAKKAKKAKAKADQKAGDEAEAAAAKLRAELDEAAGERLVEHQKLWELSVGSQGDGEG